MPEFSSRDPLQAQFWDERFAQGFTPWDKGGLPQQLCDFVAQHAAMATLIPGCGNAHEVALFAQHAWPVAAIDFSPQAVQSARHQLQALAPNLANLVQEADFFHYTPAFAVQCIYERAFLCALPPKLWPQVAARWAQLLPANGLLAGYFFIDPQAEQKPKGPPFCISQSHLNQLLDADFVCLQDEAVSDSIAVFAGLERWQVWQRRG